MNILMRNLAAAMIVVTLAALSCAQAASDLILRDETGRIYCRTNRFLVPYDAADAGPSGVKSVRLYYSADGGRTWILHGQQAEARGSFEFTASGDGVYGFAVEAVDNAGNAEHPDGPPAGSQPEVSVVVDTARPQIQPVFPRQDLELTPGAHLRVRFRARDENVAPSTASIAVRTTETEAWQTLPDMTSENGEFYAEGATLFPATYVVKLSIADRAGNTSEEVFSFVCTANAKPPAAKAGPVGSEWEVPIVAPPRAKSLAFDIDYTVEDIGGLPPETVGLWYTTDSGQSWQWYGVDADVTPPVRFQAPGEGIYGFKLTAQTRSGVSEPRPQPGTRPDITTLVDITYPTLMLDDPRGGESYAGGQSRFVRWTARDDHFGSLPVSIYVARDGGAWELLAADLPNSGSYGWNVPLIDYAAYRLKIEARDVVGNTTAVTSDTFYIVSAPPETRIKAIMPAAVALGVKQLTPEAETPREAPAPQPEPAESAQLAAPAPSAESRSARELVDKALGLRLMGDYAGAEAALREAMGKDKSNVEAPSELGVLLSQEGRHEEALEALSNARGLAPGDVEILYNIGSVYYALGRYADSAAAFETIAGIDPRNERALWNEAKACHAANDTVKARQIWQQIVAMNSPASPFARKAAQALAAVPEPKGK